MQNNVPRRCGDVDDVLVPQRPLLRDVRYIHLLDLARRVGTTGIINIKLERSRQSVDQEQPYCPLLLKMLQASFHTRMLELQRSDHSTELMHFSAIYGAFSASCLQAAAPGQLCHPLQRKLLQASSVMLTAARDTCSIHVMPVFRNAAQSTAIP